LLQKVSGRDDNIIRPEATFNRKTQTFPVLHFARTGYPVALENKHLAWNNTTFVQEARMSTNVELLSEVPLFQLLDEEERTALATSMDLVKIPSGQAVFQSNDPGDSLYIIRSGKVEIFVKDDTGHRMVLETAQTGDFFGEISLLDNGPRTASVIVLDDLEALCLNRTNLDKFVRQHPQAAMDMLTVMGRRLRQDIELLRHTASRNVNEAMEDHRTILQKSADWIAEFSGGMPFLMLNAIVFLFWILINQGLIPNFPPFDPFPYGLLTMAVSLEAIFLSIFVLISQNRQAAKDRVRSDIEYDVNLKAELEIAHLHEKVDNMHAAILGYLDQLQKKDTK
jgi:CRP/FNR family cyclic AMP-dependent transcriptional regulator